MGSRPADSDLCLAYVRSSGKWRHLLCLCRERLKKNGGGSRQQYGGKTRNYRLWREHRQKYRLNASLMSVYLLSFSKFTQPRLNLSWQAGSEGLVEDESNSPHINLLLQIVAPLSTPHCHSSILAHNVADSYSFFLWTSVSMKFLKCKTAKRGTFYMCDECMMSALVSLSSLAERRRS